MSLRPIPVSTAMQRRREAALALPVWDEVKTAVDLGCGHGVVSNLLIPRGIRIIGVDRHPLAAFGFQGELTVADAATVDLPASSADLVMALEMLEHTPTREAAIAVIANMKRITRKWLLLTVPEEERLEAGSRPCPACGRSFHIYHHFQSFSRDEIARLVDWPVAEIRTISFAESPRPPLWLVRMRRAVGLRPRKPDQTCAYCGAPVPPDPRSLPRTLIQLPVKAVGRLVRPLLKPQGWVLALFKKPEAP